MNRLSYLILFAFLVGVGVFLFREVPTTRFGEITPITAQEVRAAIIAYTDAHGANKMMEVFRESYSASHPNIQHNASHLLGEALYLALGSNGVSECTSEYNFGCYHGLFAKAIATEGLEVVKAFDVACANSDRVSACQHGLGHGILEYMSAKKLVDALNVCRDLTTPSGPLGGCASGVFMEYNHPLVSEDGNQRIEVRPLEDEEFLYTPCEDVPSEFKAACYHSLPQWWRQVVTANDYARMAELCAVIPNQSHQHACIAGLGSVIPPSLDYDVSSSIAACDTVPSELLRIQCLESASGVFWGNINDVEGAQEICEAMPDADRTRCLNLIYE
ncbi:hypothetical protein K2Y00_03540 [Patescibacteria group bacterium]|nr:hypothetical protein [Patescibacteria group bacterium]